MAWNAVPEPILWRLPKPQMHGGLQYNSLTIGAPTSEDVLKASAVHGSTGLDITLRMIKSASAEHVPYDVLKKQPHWFNQQVADYLEEFAGTPAPDPLEKWRTERRKAALARVAAEALEAEETAKAEAVTAALLAAVVPPHLIQLARSGELEYHAALAGRFYREGLRWALALPLPELLRWVRLMPRVSEREHGG